MSDECVYQVVFAIVFLYKSTFLCVLVFLRSIVVSKYGVDIISLINVVGYMSEVIWIRSIIKIIHYNIHILMYEDFFKNTHCVLIPTVHQQFFRKCPVLFPLFF